MINKQARRFFSAKAGIQYDPKNCFYKALGVKPEDDLGTIKKSYYKLAQKYHPDKCGDDKKAEEKFKTISAAWEILGCEDQRKSYDRAMKEEKEGPG